MCRTFTPAVAAPPTPAAAAAAAAGAGGAPGAGAESAKALSAADWAHFLQPADGGAAAGPAEAVHTALPDKQPQQQQFLMMMVPQTNAAAAAEQAPAQTAQTAQPLMYLLPQYTAPQTDSHAHAHAHAQPQQMLVIPQPQQQVQHTVAPAPAPATLAAPAPTQAKLQHRTCCHRCGNIRKRAVLCERCPQMYCGRCAEKMHEEHGEDAFKGGCPTCKSLCCCGVNRTTHCTHKYHCYKKCLVSKRERKERANVRKQQQLLERQVQTQEQTQEQSQAEEAAPLMPMPEAGDKRMAAFMADMPPLGDDDLVAMAYMQEEDAGAMPPPLKRLHAGPEATVPPPPQAGGVPGDQGEPLLSADDLEFLTNLFLETDGKTDAPATSSDPAMTGLPQEFFLANQEPTTMRKEVKPPVPLSDKGAHTTTTTTTTIISYPSPTASPALTDAASQSSGQSSPAPATAATAAAVALSGLPAPAPLLTQPAAGSSGYSTDDETSGNEPLSPVSGSNSGPSEVAQATALSMDSLSVDDNAWLDAIFTADAEPFPSAPTGDEQTALL